MFTLKPEDNLLAPYIDSTFKAIFTSDNEESNCALTSLLTASLNREITEIDILHNEPPVSYIQEKQIRYDILCKLNNGELVNVEMQVIPALEIAERLEYYVSKLLINQPLKGNTYNKLAKVYQISFLINGNIFPDSHAIHQFKYYDAKHNISLGGNAKIITAEASKLNLNNIEKLNSLERWLMWFKYAKETRHREEINKIIEKDGWIEMATKVLVRHSYDDVERLAAEAEEKRVMDYYSDITSAKEQGLEQGLEQGRAEGRAEDAHNLKKLGVDISIIAKATGFSEDEIKKM